ncbi:MAG: hypothetical protein WC763_04115 [Candidatus Paceibacterota bacterium]|jgi:hypothetical protein
MTNIQSGIFDKTRMVSNLLMLVLVAGNIFFSIQYSTNLSQQAAATQQDSGQRIKIARFLKLFVGTVLRTEGTVSADERIQLENDVRQLGETDIRDLWDSFVDSPTSVDYQARAVKLLAALTNKLI